MRRVALLGTAALGAVILTMVASVPADAASGPVDIGSAGSYGVLAAQSISNTGPTTIDGDIGLSPNDASSITGLSDITYSGQMHAADGPALDAQNDLGTAYTTASGLTSTPVAGPELGGLLLTPGVYSPAISLAVTGNLTLDGGGDPNATWVFQAGSTLDTATGSSITLIGGASACNVYWQVGSSATLEVGSSFVGTILADQSITVKSAVNVQGRLLARNASVTLDSDVISPPTDCTAGSGGTGGTSGTGGTTGGTTGTVSPTLPAQTLPTAFRDTPYDASLAVNGSPTPTLAVTAGALPTGLTLDSTTGAISGTPTSTQTSAFTVTASNSIGTAAVTSYTIRVRDTLASTGTNPTPLILLGASLVLFGLLTSLLAGASRRSRRAGRPSPR